jgi:flagellar basal-body rod protein FlgF
MDNPTYVGLTRQSGLMREMQVVANNIANMATTGYRREGVIFAECGATGPNDPEPVDGQRHRAQDDFAGAGRDHRDRRQFDIAIEGEGFFLVETPRGGGADPRGQFHPQRRGGACDGGRHTAARCRGGTRLRSRERAVGGHVGRRHPVGRWPAADPDRDLGAGGSDGAFAAIGHVVPRAFGVEPRDDARFVHGALEASNVNPVAEIARMIEVQRAYELGQSFLDAEDGRVRDFLRTVGART